MARKPKKRKVEKRTIIICGTEKTEPKYFNDFKRHLKKCGIHIEGLEVYNTATKNQTPSKLFAYALQKAKEYDLDFKNGDTIWCVFDHDDFGNDIRKSVDMKKYKDIMKIISSRCFELWYILHFKYSTAYISDTKKLENDLTKFLAEEYCKNKSYFEKLLPYQDKAILNAKNLKVYHEKNETRVYSDECNPYTVVYELVEHLNNL